MRKVLSIRRLRHKRILLETKLYKVLCLQLESAALTRTVEETSGIFITDCCPAKSSIYEIPDQRPHLLLETRAQFSFKI